MDIAEIQADGVLIVEPRGRMDFDHRQTLW